MTLMSRLVPDRFVLVLMLAVLVAALLPVQGATAVWAGYAVSAAIFSVFFLHGLRLPRAEVIIALRNWRLQGLMFGFVFGLMPAMALALAHLQAGVLPDYMAIGLLFLGALPSTVQSATSYSSMAGGNVAASVMASASLNLVGIVVTPLLLVVLIGQSGGSAPIGGDTIVKIAVILLLPFVLGQFAQRTLQAWALRNKPLLTMLDRFTIALAVYVAFSSAVAGGQLALIDWQVLGVLLGIVSTMLALALAASWTLGGLAGLPRADRISLLFAGSHKSIATGAPLAAILFAGPQAGLVILPTLLYHQLQLIVSAPLASRLAKSGGG